MWQCTDVSYYWPKAPVFLLFDCLTFRIRWILRKAVDQKTVQQYTLQYYNTLSQQIDHSIKCIESIPVTVTSYAQWEGVIFIKYFARDKYCNWHDNNTNLLANSWHFLYGKNYFLKRICNGCIVLLIRSNVKSAIT